MCARTNAWAAGQVVRKAEVLRDNGKYRVEGLEGSGILAVYRRGKQMVFQLTGDRCLLVHNAMSGYWDTADDPWTFDYVEGKRESTQKDVRVQFTLDTGRVLRFHDTRLFGNMKVLGWNEAVKELSRLGPEPIVTPRMLNAPTPVLNVIDMAVNCSTHRAIKEVLMDQRLLAGVGNIYATEALWKVRLHPEVEAKELGTLQITGLTEAVQGVLKEALDRNLGYDGLMIYRRKKCPLGHPTTKVEVAKRSTYLCPTCQVLS